MGRLLLSLHLNQNDRSDKAQLNVGSTFPSVEPATNQYQLWLDLYDLINCDEILDCRSVWIVASCGQQKTENAYARINKQTKKSFKWKNDKMQVEKLELDLPKDLSQVPDIIVSLWTESQGLLMKSEERVGYVRL